MKISVLLFALIPSFVIAQEKLVINGNVKGLADGMNVLLMDAQRPTDTLGQAKVKAGVFTLNAVLKEPSLVNIVFGDGKNFVTFLDNDKVKIDGDANNLKELKVTGSKRHTEFIDFQSKFDPLFTNVMRINQRMQLGKPTDSLLNAASVAKSDIEQAIDAFITSNPASPVSAFLLTATFQLTDNVIATENRLAKLKQDAVENMYGIYLKQTIAETRMTAVGSLAMDFTQADTAGLPVSLSSFRGKYVLLDFWASWCGPCRQENPNVVANYRKFSAKNFTVLGISLDRQGQKDRWLQAIHADGLTWTHLSDLQYWNNAVAMKYRVQTIPQNLLIDPEGKIVAKDLRGPALEAKLCEVLGCN